MKVVTNDLDFYGYSLDVNRIINDTLFYDYVVDKVLNFTHTTIDDVAFVNVLNECDLKITIESYYSKWTKAKAYFTKKYPNHIFINKAKLNRHPAKEYNNASIINTIVHECIHAMDYYDEDNEYGHGTNSSSGKTLSVPYLVGKLAGDFYLMQQGLPPVQPVKLKPSLWTRFKNFLWRIF